MIDNGESSAITPETRAIVERWVADMESGKFQRARGSLRSVHRKNGHCCIGVLCETLGLEPASGTKYKSTTYHPPDDPEDLLSPEGMYDDGLTNVLEHIGIPHASWHLEKLVLINDSPHTRGYSRQIAYIKENIL